MSTLGEILRTAREAKGVSASDAAKATRLKVQHIDALETDDYSNVPAPIYAKGFIRLYADYLGLDRDDLVARYRREYQPQERGPITRPDRSLEERADEERRAARPSRWKPMWNNLLQQLRKIDWRALPWGRVSLGVAILLVLVLLISGIRSCRHRRPEPRPRPEQPAPMDIIKEPPEPYLEELPPTS